MSGSSTPTEDSPTEDSPTFPVCGDCGLDFDEDDLKPLLLPCEHAHCRSCLNDQEDNDCQNCPTCSESWGGRNVAQLSVVYDLIPPGEDPTGREVAPDGRSTSSGREMVPAPTGHQVTPMETGREVTPATRGGASGSKQDKSKSSARFPVCTICEDDFNMNSQRPLKLPCGHCFCCSCLEALRSSAMSSCPKCRGEWATTDMAKLPVVKSLIHPSNRDKNVPRAPSAAAGNGGGGRSNEERLRAAEVLRSRSSTQTQRTKSEIYVRDTRSSTHTLQVDLQRDTVLHLRTLVAQATEVQPGAQRLLHNSRQLEDGYTLAHYGIRAHETITQTCRLQGGTMM